MQAELLVRFKISVVFIENLTTSNLLTQQNKKQAKAKAEAETAAAKMKVEEEARQKAEHEARMREEEDTKRRQVKISPTIICLFCKRAM